MDLSFKSEVIKLTQKVGEDHSQTLVESDIIVTDSKPDIRNILQVDGSVYVSDRMIMEGSVRILGKLCLNVLYAPDSETGSICAINPVIDFDYTAEIPGLLPEHNVFAEFEIEHIEYSLINSRKLSVRSIIAVSVQASHLCENDVAVDLETEEEVEFKKCNVSITNTVCNTQDEFVIRETLQVPTGKPPIDEVLKMDIKVDEKDSKAITNKIVAKGVLSICTLYSAYSGETVQFMEHEVDFTEVLDAPGVDDNMDVKITYHTKHVACHIKEDSDGDCVYLEIEAVIGAQIKAMMDEDIMMIADCISPRYDISIQKKEVTLERICALKDTSESIKDTITIPEELPKISQIYNVISMPFITQQIVSDGRVEIEGVIDTYVLYLTDSHSNPLYSYQKELPFQFTIECDKISQDDTVTVEVCMASVSYNMTSDMDVDLRYNLNFKLSQNIPVRCELISGATAEEKSDVMKETPSIVIYFAGSNDTIWDIAKEYSVTQKSILEMNALPENAVLSEGQQIMIPKYKRPC